MKVVSAKQMHQIDLDATNKYGIPEIVLMENAGNEIAKISISRYGDKKKYCIIAGYGNNGGDAFVAARHLINSGAKCKIFLLGNERSDKFSPSARANFNILEAMGAEIYHMVSERDWNRFQIALTFSDVVIDGLLGTGIHGELSELALKCIQQINEGKCPIVAIDIPSGLNADTGLPSPIAVKADFTVSFGLPKIGMFMSTAKSHLGELIIRNIGIPNYLLTDSSITVEAVDGNYCHANMEIRPKDVHKGTCGRILIIAGSIGYTGAGKLAAEGALRTGAGMVNLAVANIIYPIVASGMMETIVSPLPEEEPGVLGLTAFDNIMTLAEKADVILIGPGLGSNNKTHELVKALCQKITKPIVLDADGVKVFRDNLDVLAQREGKTILTPHLGELAYILNTTLEELKTDLITKAKGLATITKSIIVAKSEQTLTFYPDGNIFINTSGNEGMATAGSGDVLAGAIASLIAEGRCSTVAAPIGVYLHGKAGDISANAGIAGLIASDIAKNLQKARQEIESM